MKEIFAVGHKCEGICQRKWGEKCPARYTVDRYGRAVVCAGGKS
jgi:hypothetical protein